MNKKKKLLTVVTLVILMLGASVFTVSAADNHSVDENTTYVTNFAELEKALEATSNETNPPDKLVVLKNNIDYEEQVPGDWSYQDEQEWYSEITVSNPGKITLDLNGKTLEVTQIFVQTRRQGICLWFFQVPRQTPTSQLPQPSPADR